MKPTINLEDLRAMSRACGDTLIGLRDRALILVAYAGWMRRAENCERKTHFTTREDAQAARVDMTHGDNSRLAIYVCPICGRFVLGADRKRSRRMK